MTIEQVTAAPSAHASTLWITAHSIFTDTQARVAGVAEAVTPAERDSPAFQSAVSDIAYAASQAYRAAIVTAYTAMEREEAEATTGASDADMHGADEAAASAVPQSHYLRLTHTMWQCLELCFLTPEPALLRDTLAWLRDNFMDSVDEDLLMRVQQQLRQPDASYLASTVSNVWHVAAMLVMDGQPYEAAKWLELLARWKRDATLDEFAAMLKAFPSVTAEASDADAAAGRAFMWKAWQQKVRAVERSARWMPQREPIAAALLRIFLGDVPAGLAELPRPAPDAVDVDGGRADGDEGDVTFPYFTWANIMFCTLLYARSPVDARPKASLIHLLLDATRIMGFDLQLGKPGGVGGATCVPGAQASDNEAAVLAAVADCLTGASQAVFSAFFACGQPWAAAHAADCLWHAGVLTAPVEGSASEMPLRAQLVCDWGCQVAHMSQGVDRAALWRAGVTYAAAAEPAAVACTYATGVAAATSVRARVALASGASPLATSLTRALLKATRIDSERDAVKVAALARRTGHADVSDEIREAWARRCAAGSSALGTAWRWCLLSMRSQRTASPLLLLLTRRLTSALMRVFATALPNAPDAAAAETCDARDARAGADLPADWPVQAERILAPYDAALLSIHFDVREVASSCRAAAADALEGGDSAALPAVQPSWAHNPLLAKACDTCPPLAAALTLRRLIAELALTVRLSPLAGNGTELSTLERAHCRQLAFRCAARSLSAFLDGGAGEEGVGHRTWAPSLELRHAVVAFATAAHLFHITDGVEAAAPRTTRTQSYAPFATAPLMSVFSEVAELDEMAAAFGAAACRAALPVSRTALTSAWFAATTQS